MGVEHPSVVIVEDYASGRDALGKLFRNAGWDPVLAAGGIEATRYIHSAATPPAVFLVDLNLPDVPGIAVIKLIRDCGVRVRGTGEPVRVVAFTAMDLAKDEADAVVEAGADVILPKPIPWPVLFETVTGRKLPPEA